MPCSHVPLLLELRSSSRREDLPALAANQRTVRRPFLLYRVGERAKKGFRQKGASCLFVGGTRLACSWSPLTRTPSSMLRAEHDARRGAQQRRRLAPACVEGIEVELLVPLDLLVPHRLEEVAPEVGVVVLDLRFREGRPIGCGQMGSTLMGPLQKQ